MKSPQLNYYLAHFASISKKLKNNEGGLLAMGSGGLRCLALSTSILKCSLSIWQRRVMDPSTNSPAFTSLCFLYLSLRYLEITRGCQCFFCINCINYYWIEYIPRFSHLSRTKKGRTAVLPAPTAIGVYSLGPKILVQLKNRISN